MTMQQLIANRASESPSGDMTLIITGQRIAVDCVLPFNTIDTIDALFLREYGHDLTADPNIDIIPNNTCGYCHLSGHINEQLAHMLIDALTPLD